MTTSTFRLSDPFGLIGRDHSTGNHKPGLGFLRSLRFDQIAQWGCDMTVDKTAQTGNPEIIRLIKTLGFAGVRAWREYRQMTIKTLAQQAAVSVDMITEIEAGTYPDDPDLLDHLARILANSTKGPIVSRRY